MLSLRTYISNDTSKTPYHQIEQKQIIHNTYYIVKIQI
jgi:hypothetical protein